MESPFVTRKTYQILQQNCNKINEQRQKVARNNIELQKRIKKLEEELSLKEQELEAFKTEKIAKIPTKRRTQTKTTRKITKKEEN